MKQRTKWKRVYNPIIGVKFTDNGVYNLDYFIIEKLWQCDCGGYTQEMMQIRTDSGLVYKMPFFPWMDAWDETGKKCLGDYCNESPVMSKKKIK